MAHPPPATLRAEPPAVRGYLLSVSTAALILLVASMRAVSLSAAGVFVALLAVAAAGLMLSLSTERQLLGRRGPAPSEFGGAWAFAAALLLPAALAGALAALTYFASSVVRRQRMNRAVFNGATMMLATMSAAGTVNLLANSHRTSSALGAHPRSVAIVVCAATAFVVANYAVMSVVLLLLKRRPLRQTLLTGDNVAASAGEIGLGALVAAAWQATPYLLGFALPLMYLLHRTLLHPHLEAAARTDVKTGLHNAGHWSELARAEIARAHREQRSVGVLLADLDHFKSINDRHGHLVGDEVLRQVASALAAHVRPYDVVGRFGGEEFVVLLPNADAAETRQVAERLREQVAAIAMPSRGLYPRDLTISIGAAVLAGGAQDDLDALLEVADRAVYDAKAAGRNCVQFGLSIPAQRVMSIPTSVAAGSSAG